MDDSTILQAGTTPLMCAAQNGHEDVISILLEHKAKVDIKRKVNRVFFTHVIFRYLNFWLDICSYNMYHTYTVYIHVYVLNLLPMHVLCE